MIFRIECLKAAQKNVGIKSEDGSCAFEDLHSKGREALAMGGTEVFSKAGRRALPLVQDKVTADSFY